MVANDKHIHDVIERSGHGSGASWSLSRWGKSTGKWAEKDMDVALEMAQDASRCRLPGSSISS